MRYLLLLLIAGSLHACNDKNDLPDGVLKPQKMQDVFWDYVQADIYTTRYFKPDSSISPVIENLELQDKIFKLHHVSREEFYKSYTYYSNHKELMIKIIDSIVAKKLRQDSTAKNVKTAL